MFEESGWLPDDCEKIRSGLQWGTLGVSWRNCTAVLRLGRAWCPRRKEQRKHYMRGLSLYGSF